MFRISCRCLLLVGVDLSKLCAKKCSNLFRRIHCRFPVELHTNPRIREMNQNLLQFSRDLILQESYEFRPRFSEDLPKFSSKFRNKLISQSFWVINQRLMPTQAETTPAPPGASGCPGASATWGIGTRRAGKLCKAHSRRYRSQILQVKTRWKALAEIYTMHSFAPFSNLNVFVKNC